MLKAKKSSITSIENLSNEIFYEIFEYLNAFEIYRAFSHLNTRFENIVYHSSVFLKIFDDNITNPEFKHYCSRFIIPNKHRVVSLHFNHQSSVNIFFTFDLSFIRLQSLTINKIGSNKLIEVLYKLINLSCLSSLTIQLADKYRQLHTIYELIFRLPVLKYVHLSFISSIVFKAQSNVLSNIENAQFSPIEYLWINHSITLDKLVSLLSYTPQLRHLTCGPLFESIDNNKREVLIPLPNLTYVSIRPCHLSFYLFEIFIKQISSQLREFRFTAYQNLTYLQADEWERLIVQYMPVLVKIHIKYSESFSNYIANRPFVPQISRFTSSFWTNRQYMFELKLDTNNVIYSIQTYKQIWIHSHQKQERNHSIVTLDFADEWNESSIDVIIPTFNLIHINYLNVDCSQIHVLTFVKLLEHLLDLDAIKLSSASSLRLGYAYAEKFGIIHNISRNNNITKVNLNELTDVKHINCIIDLFPRMKYLEIEYINETDVTSILRHILTIQNNHYIPYLDILCFHIPELDDDMMMKFQKTFTDYTIKRVNRAINLFRKSQCFCILYFSTMRYLIIMFYTIL